MYHLLQIDDLLQYTIHGLKDMLIEDLMAVGLLDHHILDEVLSTLLFDKESLFCLLVLKVSQML